MLLAIHFASVSLKLKAQSSPIIAYDLFYNLYEEDDQNVESLFTKTGRITNVIYDTLGVPQLMTFTPTEYGNQLEKISSNYWIERTPQVLIYRNYGSAARIYSTVSVKLIDRNTRETLLNNTIQSVQLVKIKGQWKINHLSIQSEHPSYPIPEEMFPEGALNIAEETENKNDTDFEVRPIPDFNTEYDPNIVYQANEVDEPPVYPGSMAVYSDLLETYDVVTTPTPGYTPFLITINEDGQAELTYVHDLSGFQISRAESFVRSMMIWYPAIKYAASVKCKLVMYIRE